MCAGVLERPNILTSTILQRASSAVSNDSVIHSEEGECDSESEEGELGEGEFHNRNTEGKNKGTL